MTDKRIKNEQWTVKQLISKINNKDIIKPKFQRKKKWNTFPKKEKDTTPNEKAYIKFLYDTENSVHAITFGQESNSQRIFYSNIDGNNRINAINHFIDKPFEIFNEYLDNLFEIIDRIENIDNDKSFEIKEVFKSLSYEQITKMKTPAKFFRNMKKHELVDEIHKKEEDIEKEVEKIQNKLMLNGTTDCFNTNVKINVNLFEGYNTDELCKTFEDINKYNSKLTETELLACRLHNNCDFVINDKSFESKIKYYVKKYYEVKSEEEVLNCYIFSEEENINAHDFIVGYQSFCNEKYDFFGKSETEGMPLFFKIWKTLYGGFDDTFSTENVNNFIENIDYSCDILNNTKCKIFTDKINSKLFNKTCQEKLHSLKKNNLLMLISSIIGFKRNNSERNNITKNLKKCLLYHFFLGDIKNRDKREHFKNFDSISYRAGSGYIETTVRKLLSDPEALSKEITDTLFIELIQCLLDENNLPSERKLENGKNKYEKRRKLKFFEKTLMFFYYKVKMSTEFLENDFSIEHIMPNSSEWEGLLDKDRTGNLIPIISSINSQRGNRHINYYKKTKKCKEFCDFIKDIIPNDTSYENIIEHHKKPFIKNINKYNEMCEKNEKIYLENFITCLFK